MHYLFVMPRFIQEPGQMYWFPLGIAYVSASLKQVCSTVTCLNLNVHTRPLEEEITDYIDRYEIDVIAIGGLSTYFNQIKQVIEIAKAHKPAVITMLGGGILTATPEVLMRAIPQLDIGMIAEGEITIQELDQCFHNHRKLEDVKGIIYRDGSGAIHRTPQRADIMELDQLPFPDYDGFEFDGRGEINICTSRSCPFNCTFCFHTCGQKYRARSMDSIFSEIDWLVKRYHISKLGILDELFSTNIPRVAEFCDRIKPYGLHWGCQMRVDKLTLEILEKMKDSGCTEISYGIESADNRVLESMKKHTTIQQVERALALTRQAKMSPFGNLLLGDPADDLESFQKNYDWYQAHPDIQLGFITILVLPGSALYATAVKRGLIKDEVKYLEEGKYRINLTALTDEQYLACLKKMEAVTALREYPLENVKVTGYDDQERKYIAEGTCPLCKEKITAFTDDFLGKKRFPCYHCGRPYTFNLYSCFNRRLDRIVQERWKGKNVLLWGLNEEGYKFAAQCEFMRGEDVFIADRNARSTKAGKIRGKEIQLPGDVFQRHDIDLVLLGMSVPPTQDAIRNEIRTRYSRSVEIKNANEYLLSVSRELV